KLPRPHPVLLFHVSIVVFVVRSRTGHPNGLGTYLQILNECPVQPFTAVVEIKAQDWKRQRFLHVFGLLDHSLRPLVPDRPTLGPRASQVRVDQAPDEIPCQTAPTVSDAVGLQKPHPTLIPNLTLDRHLLAQQAARPSSVSGSVRSGFAVS